MARPIPPAALGCRSHSGWAALVALAGPPHAPHVIDRRRIEICDPAIPGSKQPYHAAEALDFAEAERHLKRCAQSTSRLAIGALREMIGDLRGHGYQPVSLSITLAAGRPLPAVKAILASHALIHTAEGEFYRNEILKAGAQCGLATAGVKERELFDLLAARFGVAPNEIERRVAELGKPIGPPWSQDQKYAALVAWISLSGS